MRPAWRIATSPSFPRNYADLYDRQRPVHRDDPFFFRHPSMPVLKRAKLFQPYDALDGYSSLLRQKRRFCEARRTLSGESEERLGRQLNKLFRLCPHARAARQAQIILRICYFVPADLPDTDERKGMGNYVTVTGMLRAISPWDEALLLDDTRIPFRDIWRLRCVSMNRPDTAASAR